jgi:hypothetical protein
MIVSVSRSRVLLTILAGVLGALGAALLLMREETHFVRHGLPAALLVAALAMSLTWRRLSDVSG